MDPNSDMGMEERREVTENMVRNRKKRDVAFPPLMIIGIIVMIFLMVVFALFFHDGGKTDVEEMNEIITRLDQLNKKLPRYAEIEKRIDQLENRIKGIQRAISKSDADRSSLRKEIGLLKNRIPSASDQAKVSTPVQKEPTPGIKRRYHEVQRGETLYRISKKYGLTVDELRKLNDLSKDQDIYPGQKLTVN